ncbi:MAG: hypothetical protein P8J42_05230, partial [Pseudomonadales bacterium]|nr:hypothetical protein [Pseudomonadales bacterium]
MLSSFFLLNHLDKCLKSLKGSITNALTIFCDEGFTLATSSLNENIFQLIGLVRFKLRAAKKRRRGVK